MGLSATLKPTELITSLYNLNTEFLKAFFDGNEHSIQGTVIKLPLCDVITPPQPSPRCVGLNLDTGCAGFAVGDYISVVGSPSINGTLQMVGGWGADIAVGVDGIQGAFKVGHVIQTNGSAPITATVTEVINLGSIRPFFSFEILSSTPRGYVYADCVEGKSNRARFEIEDITAALEVSVSLPAAQMAQIAGDQAAVVYADMIAGWAKALYESDWRSYLDERGMRNIHISAPVEFNINETLETRRMLLNFAAWKLLLPDY